MLLKFNQIMLSQFNSNPMAYKSFPCKNFSIITVADQEALILALGRGCYISLTGFQEFTEIILIDYYLIHNLGIILLKNTIAYHNNFNHKIVLDCKNSLSYTIFALENEFKYIILSKVPKEVFASLKELAISKESQLFADQENVFEYFRN
ncbi:hypothetical protein ABSA28_00414 [Candidatus Hepatincolaceae symbiont of Richtersius coronifer]